MAIKDADDQVKIAAITAMISAVLSYQSVVAAGMQTFRNGFWHRVSAKTKSCLTHIISQTTVSLQQLKELEPLIKFIGCSILEADLSDRSKQKTSLSLEERLQTSLSQVMVVEANIYAAAQVVSQMQHVPNRNSQYQQNQIPNTSLYRLTSAFLMEL